MLRCNNPSPPVAEQVRSATLIANRLWLGLSINSTGPRRPRRAPFRSTRSRGQISPHPCRTICGQDGQHPPNCLARHSIFTPLGGHPLRHTRNIYRFKSSVCVSVQPLPEYLSQRYRARCNPFPLRRSLATAEHHAITRNAESSIEERPHSAIAAAFFLANGGKTLHFVPTGQTHDRGNWLEGQDYPPAVGDKSQNRRL